MNFKVQLLVVIFVVMVWLMGDVVASKKKGKGKAQVPKTGQTFDKEQIRMRPGLGAKTQAALPQAIFKDVDNTNISRWGQMIDGMTRNDQCRDGKTPFSDATSYCGQVTRLLDGLPPYMRKGHCRHVTGGACRKIPGSNNKECTLNRYRYIKWGKVTMGWRVDPVVVRFADCVGTIAYDKAKHQEWILAGRTTP